MMVSTYRLKKQFLYEFVCVMLDTPMAHDVYPWMFADAVIDIVTLPGDEFDVSVRFNALSYSIDS